MKKFTFLLAVLFYSLVSYATPVDSLYITKQPSDTSVVFGDSVSYTVTAVAAQGVVLTYQWQYININDTVWSNITNSTIANGLYIGYNSTHLSIGLGNSSGQSQGATLPDSIKYRVIVYSANNTVISRITKFTNIYYIEGTINESIQYGNLLKRGMVYLYKKIPNSIIPQKVDSQQLTGKLYPDLVYTNATESYRFKPLNPNFTYYLYVQPDTGYYYDTINHVRDSVHLGGAYVQHPTNGGTSPSVPIFDKTDTISNGFSVTQRLEKVINFCSILIDDTIGGDTLTGQITSPCPCKTTNPVSYLKTILVDSANATATSYAYNIRYRYANTDINGNFNFKNIREPKYNKGYKILVDPIQVEKFPIYDSLNPFISKAKLQKISGIKQYFSLDNTKVSWDTSHTSNVLEPYVDNSELKIFPNPTQSIINISMSDDNTYYIKIFDNVGKTIYYTTICSGYKQVDLSQYSMGIYSVLVYNDSKQYTRKLVID